MAQSGNVHTPKSNNRHWNAPLTTLRDKSSTKLRTPTNILNKWENSMKKGHTEIEQDSGMGLNIFERWLATNPNYSSGLQPPKRSGDQATHRESIGNKHKLIRDCASTPALGSSNGSTPPGQSSQTTYEYEDSTTLNLELKNTILQLQRITGSSDSTNQRGTCTNSKHIHSSLLTTTSQSAHNKNNRIHPRTTSHIEISNQAVSGSAGDTKGMNYTPTNTAYSTICNQSQAHPLTSEKINTAYRQPQPQDDIGIPGTEPHFSTTYTAPLPPAPTGILRLLHINTGGISSKGKFADFRLLIQNLIQTQTDIFSVNEHTLDTTQRAITKDLIEIHKRYNKYGQLVMASSPET